MASLFITVRASTNVRVTAISSVAAFVQQAALVSSYRCKLVRREDLCIKTLVAYVLKTKKKQAKAGRTDRKHLDRCNEYLNECNVIESDLCALSSNHFYTLNLCSREWRDAKQIRATWQDIPDEFWSNKGAKPVRLRALHQIYNFISSDTTSMTILKKNNC